MSLENNSTEATRKVLETFYSAGEKGEWPVLMGCMDENIVIHEPDYLPYAGIHHGLAGFQKVMQGMDGVGDLTKIKRRYMAVDGERGFVAVDIPDIRSGNNFELLEESLVRNGKIVELRVYYFRAGSFLKA